MITVGIQRNKVTKLFLGSEGRLLAEVLQAVTEAAFWKKREKAWKPDNKAAARCCIPYLLNLEVT